MATSRRTATNEDIDTFGSAGQGRDYTDVGTWEGITDVNNVTAQNSPVLECYADAASYNQRLYLASATNNATYYRIIRPATGEFHDGTTGNGSGTGVFFDYSHNTNHHQIGASTSDTHSQFQDLSISVTHNSTDQRHCVRMRGADTKLIGCLIFDAQNSGTGTTIGVRAQLGANSGIINCLIANPEDDGYANNGTGNFVYNCTIVDCGVEGIDGANSVVVTNCLVDNSSSSDISHATQSYNATSDATSSGTGSRDNQTFTFVDAANGDYHLASNDTGAKDFGVDQSSDGTFDYDDDIDLETISTWSIGFDSIVAAAAVPRHATLLGVGL